MNLNPRDYLQKSATFEGLQEDLSTQTLSPKTDVGLKPRQGPPFVLDISLFCILIKFLT